MLHPLYSVRMIIKRELSDHLLADFARISVENLHLAIQDYGNGVRKQKRCGFALRRCTSFAAHGPTFFEDVSRANSAEC